MIGGFFDHDEKVLTTLADQIEFQAEHNSYEFTEQTVSLFELTAVMLRAAHEMVKRIDYLLSEDESEDAFLTLWSKRFSIEEEAEDAEEEEEEEGEEEEDEQTDD